MCHLWGPDRLSPRRRLARPSLAISHTLPSCLLPHHRKRDREAPRTSRLAQVRGRVSHQLQKPTAGYVSTRPTVRKAARLRRTAKSGRGYPLRKKRATGGTVWRRHEVKEVCTADAREASSRTPYQRVLRGGQQRLLPTQ